MVSYCSSGLQIGKSHCPTSPGWFFMVCILHWVLINGLLRVCRCDGFTWVLVEHLSYAECSLWSGWHEAKGQGRASTSEVGCAGVLTCGYSSPWLWGPWGMPRAALAWGGQQRPAHFPLLLCKRTVLHICIGDGLLTGSWEGSMHIINLPT